ncbi:glycoside hydrolase family 10 protein [Paenibacillus cymbidii]|uniref:hypothetical protein n=1 Tax=Paenibacillus cymbidii TaxID=1639034 RepID=UPI00107FF03A|nr:hypothetical protein [Paenibacillus cymbidii]
MGRHIVLNEDNSHYFFTRCDRRLTETEVDAFVDQYAGTQVGELLFCVNAMRTSYASGVWEPIWQGFDPQRGEEQPLFASAGPGEKRAGLNWMRTALQLHRDGIDPYERWIRRSREAGISPWISVRMNDVHNVDDEAHYLHNQLWRERPDLRRQQDRFEAWTDRAFDYGKQEVRDYHFALIRELAERYDFDGIELDWMRFGFHFRPGFEREGAPLLTAFTASVRRLLDEWEQRRGHRIKLSARVPSRPDAAFDLGLDACEWAAQRLVDQLVVTPFWETAETDMPIEAWKQLLRGTPVTLAAGLELLIRAYPQSPLRQKNTIETVRGMAMSYLHRGADRIYLFNYMDAMTAIDDLSQYPRLLQEVGDVATMRGGPRRHVVAYADTWAPGTPKAHLLPRVCPAERHTGLRIHIGEKPAGGQRAYICFAWREQEADTAFGGEVLVNGRLCKRAESFLPEKPLPEEPLHAFEVPEEALKDGFQYVEIKPAGRELTLTWAEIAVL